MTYSEIPACHAPVFWMEVDGKRALCAVPMRSLHRLRSASSACPWDRCASEKSAVHSSSRQAGLPQGEWKSLCPHFILRKDRGIISPKNVIAPVALLALNISPVFPDKVVSQKVKDMLLYAAIPPPFCPLCSYKNCLHKVKRVCRRRRCMWRITTRSPQNSWWEVSQHHQVKTKMVWHRGKSELVLKSTELYLCLPSDILLLLVLKRSNRGIFRIRDFFFLSINYTV